MTKQKNGQTKNGNPQQGADFALRQAKVRHGGVGAHGAWIGKPAVERLFGFSLHRVIQVGGFERAAPADDVTGAAVVFLHQRRARFGGDFYSFGQVQIPAGREEEQVEQEEKRKGEEGKKAFFHGASITKPSRRRFTRGTAQTVY